MMITTKATTTTTILFVFKSDWLSTALISALIGQYESCLSNWTVRAVKRAGCHQKKKGLGISCVLILKKSPYITNFVEVMINW